MIKWKTPGVKLSSFREAKRSRNKRLRDKYRFFTIVKEWTDGKTIKE